MMAGGKVFEKAGVNLSVVYGTMPQEVRTYLKTYLMRLGGTFECCIDLGEIFPGAGWAHRRHR